MSRMPKCYGCEKIITPIFFGKDCIEENCEVVQEYLEKRDDKIKADAINTFIEGFTRAGEKEANRAAVISNIDSRKVASYGSGIGLYVLDENEAKYINDALQRYDLVKEIRGLLKEGK